MVWITKRTEILLYILLYRYNGKDFYGVIINKLTDDEFIYSFDKKGPFIKYKAIKEK